MMNTGEYALSIAEGVNSGKAVPRMMISGKKDRTLTELWKALIMHRRGNLRPLEENSQVMYRARGIVLFALFIFI